MTGNFKSDIVSGAIVALAGRKGELPSAIKVGYCYVVVFLGQAEATKLGIAICSPGIIKYLAALLTVAIIVGIIVEVLHYIYDKQQAKRSQKPKWESTSESIDGMDQFEADIIVAVWLFLILILATILSMWIKIHWLGWEFAGLL